MGLLYNLFTQGYLFTAILLFFLYCFHTQKREYYYAMAKTANRLIGIFLFIVLLLSFYWFITFIFFAGSLPFFFDWSLSIVIIPFVIAFIALLFNKVRDKAVWIMLPVGILTNFFFILTVWVEGSDPFFTAVIERYASPVVSFLIYGTAFFLITIGLVEYATSTKKQVKKQQNKMPDRV